MSLIVSVCIIQSKDGVNGFLIYEELSVVHAYHHYYTLLNYSLTHS